MNRLVLIGNGFDLAHGLKTSYADFIDWYWEQKWREMAITYNPICEDELCRFEIINGDSKLWCNIYLENYLRFKELKLKAINITDAIIKEKDRFSFKPVKFFENILKSIETKGWVDIENEYYQLLKKCTENADCGYSVKELNDQLAFLQAKLIEYLRTIETTQYKNRELFVSMVDSFDLPDFSTEGKKKALENVGLEDMDPDEIHRDRRKLCKMTPERIMLLSFNYTATARMYDYSNIVYNYIHGELEHPENIIFGYGDELDKHYQDILDRNDNELLKNVKSVKYLETRHYHDLLEFLMSAPFQVLIMGHSCGNSDRTLLNTVFEHENCVSIKPFYHKWDDGSDNYLELVQNISRNFTNMKLFRDRVVNKEQCSII